MSTTKNLATVPSIELSNAINLIAEANGEIVRLPYSLIDEKLVPLEEHMDNENNPHKLDTDDIGAATAQEVQDLKTEFSEYKISNDAELAQQKSDLTNTNTTLTKKINDDVATEKAERQREIAVERQRINEFTNLEKGSTTGDAEMADARVDFIGHAHVNVGGNIRSLGNQFANVNGCTVYDNTSDNLLANTYLLPNSELYTSPNYDAIMLIPVEAGDVVFYSGYTGTNTDVATITAYTENNVYCYCEKLMSADGVTYTDKPILITDKNHKYISCCFNKSKGDTYSVKVYHKNNYNKLVPLFEKQYRNQLYINECRISNGELLATVETVSTIKDTIVFAKSTGVENICIMIEMLMYEGAYRRTLTDDILSKILEFAESIDCPIDFIKIHENTPIETIKADYNSWKESYTNELNKILAVVEGHNVVHFTILNEKSVFYNDTTYTEDVVSWLNLVKSKGYLTGVTTNVPIIEEIKNASSSIYLNIYPPASYCETVETNDMYEAMKIWLDSDLHNYDGDIYISEIGVMYYRELMANPASWKVKNYYHKDIKQYQQYFFNVFKLMNNTSRIIGFNDFYAHSIEQSSYLENVRKYWLKGGACNVGI